MCNGLVCISLSPLGYPLILCNPSTTRQFREIPGAEWDCDWDDENMLYVRQVSFGFGFHYSANDYKLIRIVSYTSPTRRNDIRADLYVMSTDTWTEIDVTKFSLFFGEMNEYGGYDTIVRFASSSTSALLNGVFYWPATAVQTDQVVVVVVVMSFDMGRLYYRCELEVNQGGCHVWDWCNPINQLQVPTSTYAPNDNVDAISVVELVPPVQEVERKATNMNLITVVSFIFSGIALVMAMAAIMKS
ncbi:hypothetical protein RHGRI_015497 [Rhododendron griersonianum]|uniref:F-box associated beta-propeller type 1 domain-containing protein n=1 Tax=Rhododendron griersonianum TaxID=479676 RepID=A0AAV6KDH2_9ERIC|nr:hypothetical protein RHGRI_015497 [Rhododendron griersonianum]